MIKIGEYQTFEIFREMPQGYYLLDKEEDEVLLPRAYITDDMEIGDQIVAFCYNDSEGREVATTEEPLLMINQFAYLECTSVSNTGAFCDWGTSKELLVPYANQAVRFEEGEHYVVHMYLDEYTDRLVGTTKLNKFLTKLADDDIQMYDEVDIIVYKETELGYKVIVNQTYNGLVYKNETTQNIFIGQKLTGYVKPLRRDRKLDISLDPIGYDSVEPNEKIIQDKLAANEGFLPFHDKSAPDAIRTEFGMSKKLFKKVIGSMYKKKSLEIKEDGIYTKG